MASSNIARLGVVLGLDTASFTADVDKAIAETRNLKAAITRESNAAAKEIVALKYATEDYGKEVSKVTQIEREIAAGRFKNAAPALQQQLLAQAKAYDEVSAAGKRTMGVLSEQQKLAITYQTTDLVTQIASGQNAMIALLQQGGQLKDQFGGIGNMFKALAAMITPMKVAITGLAAGFGVLGVAFYQGARDAAELRDQLILTGNYANLTQKTFLDLADTVSTKTNLSIGKTKDILMELVKSGKFTDQSLGSVAQAIANVTKLSGETATEVAQKLIPAFDGGASSIKSLNDRMNFLTLEQYKHIVLLDKQGKAQEAAKVAADALNKKLQDQERQVGTLEGAWTKLKNAASAAWNALLNIGRPQTLEEQLDQINQFITAAANQLNKANPDSVYYGKLLQSFQEFVSKRQAILDKMQAGEEAAKKSQQDTQAINDEVKFGEKRRQLAFEIDQAIVKNQYDLRRMTANDMMTIELNAQEKIFLARNEMAKKNQAEADVFVEQNAKLLSQQLIQIEQDKQKQLRDLARKRYADEMADRQKLADEAMNDLAQEQSRRDQIYNQLVQTGQVEKESLEYEMQKLQLKGSLIGASDKALQIAMLELETQRKIAEIMANPDLSPEKRDLLISQARRNQGMQEMFISMQDSLKATQRVYDAVFGNMEKALENFVRTGKLSFKDLARSIIQDLIMIQLKASATMLFNSFLRSMGFSFGSASGGTITGGSGLIPRASGGAVSAGTSYMVGEKGPEMFVPRTSGTIVPNNALSSVGGSQVINNYNIQAIDVKSFEDRIMGSSTAVWAANAYANKSLAIGRGRA
jgi:lambda family phage tail tape measure protein